MRFWKQPSKKGPEDDVLLPASPTSGPSFYIGTTTQERPRLDKQAVKFELTYWIDKAYGLRKVLEESPQFGPQLERRALEEELLHLEKRGSRLRKAWLTAQGSEAELCCKQIDTLRFRIEQLCAEAGPIPEAILGSSPPEDDWPWWVSKEVCHVD